MLKILLSNPLIKRSGDEVNQKVLVKWIIQHRKSNDEQITINEIEKLISRLCSLGILSQKECENGTYLCANDSYFENKEGEKNPSSRSTNLSHRLVGIKSRSESAQLIQRKYLISMIIKTNTIWSIMIF